MNDDSEILTSTKYLAYGLLGSAAALKAVSWVLGLLGGIGRGQLSSSAQAHNASHTLSHLSGSLAMAAVAIVLLAVAYGASCFIRPVGFSLDDVGHKGGIIRFAIEVGLIIGAGALSLMMCDYSGHVLVGFIAAGAALAYGVVRSLEFLGAERLTRPGRFVLERLSHGRIRLHAPKAAGAGRQSESYAEHMREHRAGQQAAKPKRAKRAERAVSTTLTTTPGPDAAADEHLLPMTPARPLEVVLADIDGRIGLSDFKARLRRDLAYQRAEKMKMDADPEYDSSHRKLHCVYSGPPGTGKTMSARLHAEAYASLNISNGRYAATSASKLLSGVYIGSARKALGELLESAAGGVVFLDEFGALLSAHGSGGNMGNEVVEELLDRLRTML